MKNIPNNVICWFFLNQNQLEIYEIHINQILLLSPYFPNDSPIQGYSFIFQHEVKGKYLRGEDEDEDCDKDEDDSVIQFFK